MGTRLLARGFAPGGEAWGGVSTGAGTTLASTNNMSGRQQLGRVAAPRSVGQDAWRHGHVARSARAGLGSRDHFNLPGTQALFLWGNILRCLLSLCVLVYYTWQPTRLVSLEKGRSFISRWSVRPSDPNWAGFR